MLFYSIMIFITFDEKRLNEIEKINLMQISLSIFPDHSHCYNTKSDIESKSKKH